MIYLIIGGIIIFAYLFYWNYNRYPINKFRFNRVDPHINNANSISRHYYNCAMCRNGDFIIEGSRFAKKFIIELLEEYPYEDCKLIFIADDIGSHSSISSRKYYGTHFDGWYFDDKDMELLKNIFKDNGY